MPTADHVWLVRTYDPEIGWDESGTLFRERDAAIGFLKGTALDVLADFDVYGSEADHSVTFNTSYGEPIVVWRLDLDDAADTMMVVAERQVVH